MTKRFFFAKGVRSRFAVSFLLQIKLNKLIILLRCLGWREFHSKSILNKFLQEMSKVDMVNRLRRLWFGMLPAVRELLFLNRNREPGLLPGWLWRLVGYLKMRSLLKKSSITIVI